VGAEGKGKNFFFLQSLLSLFLLLARTSPARDPSFGMVTAGWKEKKRNGPREDDRQMYLTEKENEGVQ